MGEVVPAIALVRPRVLVGDGGDARPLDEVVAELGEEGAAGVWRLVGNPGSGRSTALAHLAAVFTHDERLIFLDAPTPEELAECPPDAIIVASLPRVKNESGTQLAMADWGRDELIEYLLSVDQEACGSVIDRLGDSVHWDWSPFSARMVLDFFIRDQNARDPTAVLVDFVRRQHADKRQFEAACRFCLSALTSNRKDLASSADEIMKLGGQDSTANLLFLDERVRVALAADLLVSLLSSRKAVRELESRLPFELLSEVGRRCREIPKAMRGLRKYVPSRRRDAGLAMAASIRFAADPAWQPESRLGRRWNLSRAYFAGAKWPKVNLGKASLLETDFTGAELGSAELSGAFASDARFDGADLSGARLLGVSASGAHFSGACLRRAVLTRAQLNQADFTRADLTSACLRHAHLINANLSAACCFRADLTGAQLDCTTLADVNFAFATLSQAGLARVDLRTARLDGADFQSANLTNAELEDVVIIDGNFQQAMLRNAHLTGSRLRGANLQGAILCGAGLAEIEWEGADLRGADLRGATFHMGSSRSGLVGSPIACEGSRTGFYTDDREEVYFKHPEEVRKANLCGADLRGANIRDVDFYLVDLREAQLDASQVELVRKSGAILEDYVA